MKRNIDNRGFSLIELIVVIAIITLLAGAMVPMAAQALTSSRNDATRAIVAELRDASLRFAEDTLRPPKDLTELRSGSSIKGWNGPYTSAEFDSAGPGSTLGGFAVDGFGKPLTAKLTGSWILTIASAGEDGVANTSDDITSTLDITPTLRAESQRRLAVVNQAVILYNRDFLPDNPLTTPWSNAVKSLVKEKYLPDDARFGADAWGDAFILSGSPPMSVESKHASIPTSAGSKSKKNTTKSSQTNGSSGGSKPDPKAQNNGSKSKKG